ncbi:MAG: autotransporter domain-containing protein [Rhizomicrobium sp.]
MKRSALVLCVGAAICVSSPSSAARQAAVGPGIIALDANGVLSGVDMSVSGITGTLSVGVVGGPAMDIYTLNNPVVAGQVAISTAASSQGNVVFNSGSTVYGAIGVTQPGGPFLLNITGGNAGASVNFMGPVYATTTNVTGTGSLNFRSGNTNITATNFAADGTISLAANTTVIGALTTTVGANTGTLILGAASVLNGAVGGAVGLKTINVVGGSNSAGVSATITGAVDAFAFSLGTNTLNIGGALTIANLGAAGVVNTTLASASVYGNIRPLGATNLGPALHVNVTVPSTSLLTVGTIFNIVQTQSGTLQSGTDGSVVTVTIQDPTNPLYTFEAVPPAGTVAGLVAIRLTGIPLTVPIAPPPGVTLPPTEPIAVVVVPVLLAVTPTTDLAGVLAAINALSNPAQVVNAVAQLAPSTPDLAAGLVTFEGTRAFQDFYKSRLDESFCGPGSEPDRTGRPDEVCRLTDPGGGWWVKGFGLFATQEARQAFQGYGSRNLGVMVAYDTPLGSDTRAGLGVGYAHSAIDSRNFAARTEANTYQATAYVVHQAGPWFAYGDVSAGLNSYSGTRRIVFTGVDRQADASYDGNTLTGFVATGYHIPLDSFTITPLASLQYSNIRLDGYTETGAGDISLAVQSQSYDFLESGLGVEVAHPFQRRYGTYVPEMHFKWLHELDNPTLSNTAAFAAPGSPVFTTPGLKPGDDTYDVGAGLTLATCACSGETWALESVYDHFWRNDGYVANQWLLKFTGRF